MPRSKAGITATKTEPLFCPCCGDLPVVQHIVGVEFPDRVKCRNYLCGMSTPWLKGRDIAVAVWNRRLARKPARRADKS